MRLDRRTLLIGGGAGVGLVVAWALLPRRYAPGLDAREGEHVLGHYLKVGTDGRVTVAVPQVETGQGVWTALPQLLADELGAAWESVAVQPAPASPVYANALRPFDIEGRVTAGATSIRAFHRPFREAGAVARGLLNSAAARRWGVSAAECDTEGGFVVHEGKRLPFGALAEAAAALKPAAPVLRPSGRGKLAGQSLPRLDAPPKSDGSFRFAGDVRLPNMVYAAAAFGPKNAQVTAGSESRSVRTGPGWIAAIGPTSWAAERALRATNPRVSGTAGFESEDIDRALRDALESGERTALLQRGEPDKVRGRGIFADYSAGALLHTGLEPLTATARLSDGRLELWAATQAPDETRRAAAGAAGVGLGETLLYPMPAGVPDGRALYADAAPIAATLAQQLGRPVQVTVFPAQGRRSDRVLAPSRARLRAELGPDNRLLLWQATVAGHSSGHAGFPYSGPALDIALVEAALPFAPTYLRGGDTLFAAFARESFIDELARHAGFEPLAFRMAMLSGQPRLARVLTGAAALGGWDGGGPGSSMGLACHSAYGSHIGLLASAGIGPDQRVKVDRLVAVVDCGEAVNPGLVRQQVEGGLLGGLALAGGTEPEFAHGLVTGGGPEALRLAGTPEIVVEIVPSRAAPGGVSGLGVAAVAPAVANAVTAATGKRLRSLPFAPMAAA